MTHIDPDYPCHGVCPTAWTWHDVGARDLCGLPGPTRLPIAALTVVAATHPSAADTLARLPLVAASHVVGAEFCPGPAGGDGARPVWLRYTFTNPHGHRLRIRAVANTPQRCAEIRHRGRRLRITQLADYPEFAVIVAGPRASTVRAVTWQGILPVIDQPARHPSHLPGGRLDTIDVSWWQRDAPVIIDALHRIQSLPRDPGGRPEPWPELGEAFAESLREDEALAHTANALLRYLRADIQLCPTYGYTSLVIAGREVPLRTAGPTLRHLLAWVMEIAHAEINPGQPMIHVLQRPEAVLPPDMHVGLLELVALTAAPHGHRWIISSASTRLVDGLDAIRGIILDPAHVTVHRPSPHRPSPHLPG